ncbi:MAG: DUF2247 family protein [Acidovorax sp.]|uniref:DUF2247 family protein n=1 Tax=Acidovorax sp. TaxID=1872122 RepID=UPI0025B7CD34|nr:DUF2247 family protein [Acidovorax sp.]MCE1190635.1 DUF2247 family protein [Acidovorax sp.]
MRTIFDRISKYGLADWAVVFQGASGIPGHSDRLPPDCVESFANVELEKVAVDDPLLDAIVSLADDSDLPASELCPQLQKMCDSKNLDMQRARRIWRAVALEEVLANLDSDTISGMMELAGFWSNWGWPADAPASMLSGANALPTQDYHSASNYDRVIHENEQWLKVELAALREVRGF